jgi:hypothetical protein
MPAVSFDSKSFLLPAGRGVAVRFPVVGAAFDAALVDPERWDATLGGLRHAGFNTVVIRVPWLMHEPTPDRMVFEGACDLRRAVQAAAAAGLKVMLRIGPCVGGSFARGGLPDWIHAVAGERVREANPAFMARVTRFWHALAPHFVDLQATRNGNGTPRPVIAVGIEDDWRCLDTDVGAAYFGALVRFAREVGIDVPLFTANNCWYSHEGVIDAWSNASDIARTAEELREVHPDAPPLMFHDAGDAARLAEASVVARVDFVCEVVGGAHRGATSARGCAQRLAQDLHPLRRALVFGTTLGEAIAASTPPLPGIGRLAQPLAIGGSTLERCTGSIVALLGDLLVVAGAPRARVAVKVDGSEVALMVPTDSGLPKVQKVRGVRVAVVPNALAAGVGLADDAIEFVDEAGVVLVRVMRDGTVARRAKAANGGTAAKGGTAARGAKAAASMSSSANAGAIALSAPVCVAEPQFLDGTHARYAAIDSTRALGELGVQSMHGFLCARFDRPVRKGREPWLDARGIARTERAATRTRATTIACEVRADFGPRHGSHTDERAGVVGPLRDVGPLRGVKGALVDLPRFDATRIGRFAWGYDARADAAHRRTARWTFAARTSAVIVRMPDWWFDEGHAAAGHALRLNGELVATDAWCARAAIVLDAARLSPMRPVKLAKGEKPPKAKAAKLEPGANELLLDLDAHGALDERKLARLMGDVVFLDAGAEIAAAWSFARVHPPASWATARPMPRKALAAPTWFRTVFTLDAPRALELEAVHAAGSVATVLVNGQAAMVLDGASGVASGNARARRLARTASLPASLLRAGENEVCVFEPGGVMPALALRDPSSGIATPATARSGARRS